MKQLISRRPARLRRIWARALSAASIVALGDAVALAPSAQAQAQTISFDIDSQPLSAALLAFGRQAGVSVLAPTSLVEGKIAPDVRGRFSTAAALTKLLENSGLRFEFVTPGAIRIAAVDHAALQAPAVLPSSVSPADTKVVVVGTTISGIYPASSPVEIYTSDDIAKSGATTTEEFVAKLPQNLATMTPFAASVTRDQSNFDSVSSVDLRGLGVGTTLTLLNGHRMAPSNSGQSTDVSVIPAGAIERVEVLTDGASAIYGSDAVGGVINFVLRDDFDGAETRLSYGGVTRGGLRRGEFSHAFGSRWQDGHGLLSYGYQSASALRRSDRDYAAEAGAGNLSPIETRHNILAAVEQNVGDRLGINFDLALARRNVKNASSSPLTVAFATRSLTTYWSETDFAQANLGLDYTINDAVKATLSVSYSGNDIDGERYTLRYNRVPQQLLITDYSAASSALEVMGKLDGRLLPLPGGDLRFSVGGGFLDETFKGIAPATLAQSAGEMSRRSPFAFAEVFAPLVGPEQAIPLVRRLELSLAARYTDYQDTSSPPLNRDFGDSTDPKVGLLWSPIDSLNIRATYGTSFRAPSLTQLDPTSAGHSLANATIAGASAIVLNLSSQAAADTGPETAETFTAGFDLEPAVLPGFRLSATYYNIDYTDRIGVAPNGGINPFASPTLLPDLIYHPPSAAFVEAQLLYTPLTTNNTNIDLGNPAAAAAILAANPNFWVFDGRYKNLALSQQDGFDLAGRQSLQTAFGDLRLGANVTRILDYRQQASPSSAILTNVGIPARSPHWRGRANISLARDGLSGALNINHVGSYSNTWLAGSPDVKSWTTLDLSISYQSSREVDNGARLTLSIQNLLDRDPPYLNIGSGGAISSPIGFDPVNANPLGRVVVVGLSTKW